MGEIVALPANQIKALETLLQTGSITEAAEAAGVTCRTVQRWMRNENFKSALAEAEADTLALAALPVNQVKAIEFLLQTGSTIKTAQAVGVSPRTIQRWMKDKAFRYALAEAEALALAAVASAMAGNANKAQEALVKIFDDPGATNQEKIQAARAYLGALPQVRILGSLETRLVSLEDGNDDDT